MRKRAPSTIRWPQLQVQSDRSKPENFARRLKLLKSLAEICVKLGGRPRRERGKRRTYQGLPDVFPILGVEFRYSLGHDHDDLRILDPQMATLAATFPLEIARSRQKIVAAATGITNLRTARTIFALLGGEETKR